MSFLTWLIWRKPITEHFEFWLPCQFIPFLLLSYATLANRSLFTGISFLLSEQTPLCSLKCLLPSQRQIGFQFITFAYLRYDVNSSIITGLRLYNPARSLWRSLNTWVSQYTTASLDTELRSLSSNLLTALRTRVKQPSNSSAYRAWNMSVSVNNYAGLTTRLGFISIRHALTETRSHWHHCSLWPFCPSDTKNPLSLV